MTAVETTTDSSTQSECYVFVDHSNLWIAGQKASAKKLKDTDVDSRFRVDLGKFLKLLARDRHISKAFLYGSVPPPNDSVWKAAKQRNFDVKTFQRSGSGREKELDVAMATDIIDTLLSTTHTKDTVFITVTGDRDLKPPIELTIKNNVHVELWSWDHSMAREFRQLANTSDLFTVKKLDDVRDSFGYTAVLSTHQNRDIDPAHAIVYRDVPKGKRFVYGLADHVARLMRVFYITINDFKEEEKQDLVFVFPYTKPDVVIQQLRKMEGIEYHLCSYPEYKCSLHQESKPIQTSNKYEALDTEIDEESLPDLIESSMSLDIEDIKSSRQPTENGAEPTDDWTTVVRRKVGRMTFTRRRKETACKWGDHCAKASECPYKHSEYENHLFSRYPRIQFRKFKSEECSKKEKHDSDESRKWCPFAHDDTDSWCLKCRMYGHLERDCQG